MSAHSPKDPTDTAKLDIPSLLAHLDGALAHEAAQCLEPIRRVWVGMRPPRLGGLAEVTAYGRLRSDLLRSARIGYKELADRTVAHLHRRSRASAFDPAMLQDLERRVPKLLRPPIVRFIARSERSFVVFFGVSTILLGINSIGVLYIDGWWDSDPFYSIGITAQFTFWAAFIAFFVEAARPLEARARYIRAFFQQDARRRLLRCEEAIRSASQQQDGGHQ